jgi:hypothetical protein
MLQHNSDGLLLRFGLELLADTHAVQRLRSLLQAV